MVRWSCTTGGGTLSSQSGSRTSATQHDQSSRRTTRQDLHRQVPPGTPGDQFESLPEDYGNDAYHDGQFPEQFLG